MGSVVLDGIKHTIVPSSYITGDYFWLESFSRSLVLVRGMDVVSTGLVAIGGAYFSNGGGGRWIAAKFAQPHPVGLELDSATVRGWVIQERQSSINAYSSAQAKVVVGDLVGLPKWASRGLPEPVPHKILADVTDVEPLWDV